MVFFEKSLYVVGYRETKKCGKKKGAFFYASGAVVFFFSWRLLFSFFCGLLASRHVVCVCVCA
jgi:hypothetical protein